MVALGWLDENGDPTPEAAAGFKTPEAGRGHRGLGGDVAPARRSRRALPRGLRGRRARHRTRRPRRPRLRRRPRGRGPSLGRLGRADGRGRLRLTARGAPTRARAGRAPDVHRRCDGRGRRVGSTGAITRPAQEGSPAVALRRCDAPESAVNGDSRSGARARNAPADAGSWTSWIPRSWDGTEVFESRSCRSRGPRRGRIWIVPTWCGAGVDHRAPRCGGNGAVRCSACSSRSPWAPALALWLILAAHPVGARAEDGAAGVPAAPAAVETVGPAVVVTSNSCIADDPRDVVAVEGPGGRRLMPLDGCGTPVGSKLTVRMAFVGTEPAADTPGACARYRFLGRARRDRARRVAAHRSPRDPAHRRRRARDGRPARRRGARAVPPARGPHDGPPPARTTTTTAAPRPAARPGRRSGRRPPSRVASRPVGEGRTARRARRRASRAGTPRGRLAPDHRERRGPPAEPGHARRRVASPGRRSAPPLGWSCDLQRDRPRTGAAPTCARQRAARAPRARSGRPRRGRRRPRGRRLPLRARGPHRVRPPLRAPDVPGLGEPGEARPLPARAVVGRRLQRLDAPGLHELLRGPAVGGAGAGAVPRGRPAARPAPDAGEPAQPGGRGQGGDPPQRPQPALRRLPLDPAAAGALRHLPERPQRVRRLHRPRAGLPRRRRRVLRRLLRAGQRGAHRRRGPRPGRDGGARRQALRRHPRPRGADAPELRRAPARRGAPGVGGRRATPRCRPWPWGTACPTRTPTCPGTSRTPCWRACSPTARPRG